MLKISNGPRESVRERRNVAHRGFSRVIVETTYIIFKNELAATALFLVANYVGKSYLLRAIHKIILGYDYVDL